MIDVNINRGKGHASIAGSLKEVTADIAYLLGATYSQINSQSVEAAIEFRIILSHLILDPDSPVWCMSEQEASCCKVLNPDKITAQDIVDIAKSGAPLEAIETFLRSE